MELDLYRVKNLLPKRNENSNKGTFGTALLICGSFGMAGAACFCASAAARSGCGLVKQILPESIYPIAASSVHEAVFVPVSQNKSGGISRFEADKIINIAADASSVLVGCGMQNTPDTAEIVSQLIKNYDGPLVIDADGINSIAGCIDILRESKHTPILTPHPKEFSRICKKSVADIESSRQAAASEFARE